jgi:hypothetical protein
MEVKFYTEKRTRSYGDRNFYHDTVKIFRENDFVSQNATDLKTGSCVKKITFRDCENDENGKPLIVYKYRVTNLYKVLSGLNQPDATCKSNCLIIDGQKFAYNRVFWSKNKNIDNFLRKIKIDNFLEFFEQ